MGYPLNQLDKDLANGALGYLWSPNISHNAILVFFTTWRRLPNADAADHAADLFASPELFSTRKQASMPSSTLQLVRRIRGYVH